MRGKDGYNSSDAPGKELKDCQTREIRPTCDGWTRLALRIMRIDEFNIVFFVGVLEKPFQLPKCLSLCHLV